MSDYTVADRDLAKGHERLRIRLPIALTRIGERLRCPVVVVEVFRSNIRQAWLFGQGRTANDLRLVGLDPALARPDAKRVTNAWSAALSAHGHTLKDGTPAACAADVDPLGADGKPWTKDDPWDAFVAAVASLEHETGLRHFHKPGKPPWDRPHLQLVEWNDARHELAL